MGGSIFKTAQVKNVESPLVNAECFLISEHDQRLAAICNAGICVPEACPASMLVSAAAPEALMCVFAAIHFPRFPCEH